MTNFVCSPYRTCYEPSLLFLTPFQLQIQTLL